MDRLGVSGYRDAVALVRERLPRALGDRLRGVDFLCGSDPIFAGLHQVADVVPEHGVYAHTAFRHNTTDRSTTVVLNGIGRWDVPAPLVVAHELGHALHETIGFRWHASAVSKYAKTNSIEAFAEAFELWLLGPRWLDGGKTDLGYGRCDAATEALFRQLATSG